MDEGWGEGWPGEDYADDAADTADLGGIEPLTDTGLEGYDEPVGGSLDQVADPGEDSTPPFQNVDPFGQPGGYLEDDPMGGFGSAADPGDDGQPDDIEPTGPGDIDEPLGVEAIVGADPDIDPDGDWAPADFPAPLDFTPPEPVDGYPWSDATAVAGPGGGDGVDPFAVPQDVPPLHDLFDYAGMDAVGDPWTALAGSDDPASGALGRWWAPSG